MSEVAKRDYAKEGALDHIFHVWINERQMARQKQGMLWESSLYEWKSMLGELQRIPYWLHKARTGALPDQHQQCSLSPVETIEKNTLICALGTDVTQCPILQSLYAKFGDLSDYHKSKGLTLEDADDLAARVCTWHIFTTKLTDQPHLDTSEGYVQDASDRMFWDHYFHSMAGVDMAPGEGEERWV
mgnify:CR=1 FL=1